MTNAPLTWEQCRFGAVVVGAHGGAGTSTVRAFLPDPAYDVGCLRQPDGVFQEVETFGRPLILVARATVLGARAAAEAARELAEQGHTVACLALVSDGAGAEPLDVKIRMRLLEPRVHALVRVPFVAELRSVEQPHQVLPLPRRAQYAMAAIVAAVEENAAQSLLPEQTSANEHEMV